MELVGNSIVGSHNAPKYSSCVGWHQVPTQPVIALIQNSGGILLWWLVGYPVPSSSNQLLSSKIDTLKMYS